MAWKMKGRYVASCSCTNVCPCSTASAPPDNPDGSTNCWGMAVFNVREGNLDTVDLSGLNLGLSVHYPGLVSDGSWQIGATVNDSASDEQVSALTAILSGKQGGPFADMAALITDFKGVERGAVSFSETSVSYGGSSVTYEPLKGQDGSPTTIKNAVFGFAPEFEIGACKGQIDVFGHAAPASYGEAADFEYGSEIHEHIRA